MADEFDRASFDLLPKDTQAAAAQIISSLNNATAVRGVTGDISAVEWEATSGYLSNATKALTAANVLGSLAEGDNEQAFEDASKWVAGDLLSKGYGNVIENVTRDGFIQQHGYRKAGQMFHRQWSEHIGGLGADLTVDVALAAGHTLKEGLMTDLQERFKSQQNLSSHHRDMNREYTDIRDAMAAGGIDEYAHFEELADANGMGRTPENHLQAWHDRPRDSNLHNDLKDSVQGAGNEILNHPIPRRRGLFSPGVEGVDNLSDVVTKEGGVYDPRLNVDLVAADRLAQQQADRLDIRHPGNTEIDFRDDIERYVTGYAGDAKRDGRNIDPAKLQGDTDQIIDKAGTLQLELGKSPDNADLQNTSFYGGVLDASNSAEGAVLISRDGGRHTGSAHDDLSLDGSHVEAGGGDDYVALDARVGEYQDATSIAKYGPAGKAYGGAGDDRLNGGLHADQLHGGAGEDALSGDKGNDVLYGTGLDRETHNVKGQDTPDDGVRDILIGGEGQDNYYAGDKDVIIATEGKDKDDIINFAGFTLQGPDGVAYDDGILRGVNGETYTQTDEGALIVSYGDKALTIEKYQAGDFGIDLSPEAAPQMEDTTLETVQPINYVPGSSPQGTTQRNTEGNIEAIIPGFSVRNAVETLAADQETMNRTFEETGLSSPAREAVNHPSAARMFDNLNTGGVETLSAEINPDMDVEERVGTILKAGIEASREAGIELPSEIPDQDHTTLMAKDHIHEDDISASV